MVLSVFEESPILKFLRERETLIPRPKLAELFGSILGKLQGLQGQAALPPGVTSEQAIEIVANSAWARNLAEGVCGSKYVGFTPGTPEYERCVYNVSHRVAAAVLGLPWSPPPTPIERRRRR